MFEQPGWTRRSDRGVDLKYSREENPTVRALEHTLSGLEGGGDALCFSSGMAAISAVYHYFLKSGDTVVLPAEAYGTTIQLAEKLAAFGVKTRVVWPETEDILEAIDEGIKLVLVETITNPMLRVFDIPRIAERCGEVGAALVVDNTFATPVLYRPLQDRATLVVHSVTKFLSGHNDVVAGAIIGESGLVKELWDWRRMLGTILSPFEAYQVLRGLKTLELRVRKHCENAQSVAEFLHEHPKVTEVLYPGLPESKYHEVAKKILRGGYGGLVSFRIKGGEEEVKRFMKPLRVVKPAPSLGGPESLLTYPIISAASTMSEETRKKLGITENLLRLSVGLEDLNDIINDLDNALKNI